jgi:hypothetical protein
MQTLAPIKRRSATVELSARELAILDNCLFDAVVRLLKDSRQFDYLDPDDSEQFQQFQEDAHAMRHLQRKIQATLEKI